MKGTAISRDETAGLFFWQRETRVEETAPQNTEKTTISQNPPTFDSGDREWDSAEIEYLMFDGKDIHLIIMRGGYRIAYLIFYEKLLTADARMKPIFKKLSWPVDNITWT